MKSWSVAMSCLCVLALADTTRAQSAVFSDIKARFSKSAEDRHLVSRDAELVLDDGTRRLLVKNREHPLDVGYDDIQKVVFDVSTHMRGGGRMMGLVSSALPNIPIGLLGSNPISATRVNDYWCLLEYEGPDGAVHAYMLEISRESSVRLIEKMEALFGGRVSLAAFAETPEEFDKKTLKELQSKHDVNVGEGGHPMPEARRDQALVIVVCPSLTAGDTGKGPQVKLHANDRVVMVNKRGMYSFAHLDPGEYLLVSQTENASGFRMRLEAGTAYYFFQDTFAGILKNRTGLSRHTKEVVMYELNGADYSLWRSK